MKKILAVKLLALSLLSPAFGQDKLESRQWTSKAGTSVDATLLAFSGGMATLELEGGKTMSVRADQLSEKDQEYLAAWKPAGGTNWESVPEIKKGLSGSPLPSGTRASTNFTIAPLADKPVECARSGAVPEPYKIRALIPPDTRDECILATLTVTKSPSRETQSYNSFGLNAGYNEVEIGHISMGGLDMELEPANTEVTVYAVILDGRSSSRSNILRISGSVK